MGWILICLGLVQAASSNPTFNQTSTTFSTFINPSIPTNSVNQTNTASIINQESSSLPSNQINQPSTTSINPTITSSIFGQAKPSSNYQVTENIIDIPDGSTLSPIIPNYSLSKPLNLANTSININKFIKNDTGDENNHSKKTSFTFVHFSKETPDKKDDGINKLFRGIRDYVYNLKKGVVDGLHFYFHRDDRKNGKEQSFYTKFRESNGDFDIDDDEKDFYRKFYRNFHNDEEFDDYENYHEELKDEIDK